MHSPNWYRQLKLDITSLYFNTKFSHLLSKKSDKLFQFKFKMNSFLPAKILLIAQIHLFSYKTEKNRNKVKWKLAWTFRALLLFHLENCVSFYFSYCNLHQIKWRKNYLSNMYTRIVWLIYTIHLSYWKFENWRIENENSRLWCSFRLLSLFGWKCQFHSGCDEMNI